MFRYSYIVCLVLVLNLVVYKLRTWILSFNPLNAELNPICHLLALLGSATIVVVSRLKVNKNTWTDNVIKEETNEGSAASVV